MSAERTPQMEPSLLAKPLVWITRLAVRFPVPVVVLAVALAVFSLAYSASRLGFRTSRLDLINPDSNYNQLWIEYINDFGDADDVVVVVEGTDRDQVVTVLEEVSAALAREDHLFHAVLHEVDLSTIRGKGLHYLPPSELLGIEDFLDKAQPVINGDWSQLKLGQTARRLSGQLAADQSELSPAGRMAAYAELDRLSESLLSALGSSARYRSPWPEMPLSIATLSELSSEYFLTNEGRMGFVLLRLAGQKDKDAFTQGSDSIDALRDVIGRVQTHHQDATIGLTGLPVMENDEMRSSEAAMMKASLLSLFGVACLFVAGFGGLRHPLITVGSLLLALAWSFGYVTLGIGHLNILSISFGVILIGLGIDFGVHYAARYLQLRGTMRSSEEALIETAAGVGPGIITGAITTAISFFMAGFTEFTGIAELGLIAGGGVLLCCLAAIVVLPAMIHISDAKRTGTIVPKPLDIHGWLGPLFARPGLLMTATAVGTVVLALGMGHFFKHGWYDHNLLNLQPEGIESVALERKLLAESDQSVWFALSIAESREELLARKAQFSKLQSVERVDEIASLIPVNDTRKRPIIERIRQRLAALPERPPQIPVDHPDELGRVLAQAQMVSAAGPSGMRVGRRLEQVRDLLRRMPLAECYQRLSEYQHYMAGDLLSRLHLLNSMANPEPPRLSDLPSGLVTRFVGQDGKHLLKIYSKADIWDMDAMEQFVREVRSVDSRVTGNPLQTYEASRQMQQSYIQAAWYALAAILLVLFIDFGSLRFTLLAMFPMAVGMLQMFGILGLLKLQLNPANMIVLPLILGIGIDDGVHVVHDFRRTPGRYRMSASTASSVLITSLTTMVGFGSLMIASHRGLESLGRVLTIGVSCCMFNSLIMLPALLIWNTRNRNDEPDQEPHSNAANGEQKTYRRDPPHHPGTSRHAAGRPTHNGHTVVRER